MQQGFPLESYQQAATEVTRCHALFLPLLGACLLVFYVTNRRPARPRDTFWWSAAAVVAAWIAALLIPSLTGRSLYRETELFRADALLPYVRTYAAVIWLLASVGMATTTLRLRRQGQPTRVVDGLSLILIFVVFTGLLAPTSSGRTDRGRCYSQLASIGRALDEHLKSHDVFLAAVAGTPEVSWRVALLPYYSSDRDRELAQLYQRDQSWDAAANLVVATSSSPYECPSNRHAEDELHRRYTAYAMLTGPGTFGGGETGSKLSEMIDSTSNTIAVVEAVGLQIIWTEPRDVDVAKHPLGINLLGSKPAESPGILSSYHLEHAHVLMADGSVRFLSESIDPALLKKLTTIAGDETVDTTTGSN